MGKWLANLLVMIVAAAIPCGVGEAVLRVMAPPADTPGLFVKVPSQREWSGRPYARGLHAGVPVAFNTLGLRDAERTQRAAPGTIRILALGDSVTFGMGVAQEETYPRQAERLLSERRGAPVEVLNMGMPGYNSVHQLAQLRELGLALDPKVIVVGFLYNDITPSSAQREQVSRRPEDLSLKRRVKSGINATTVWLKKNSMFFAWLTPRMGSALRPLGVKGFGQVGEIKDRYVESNPHWQRTRSALAEMKRLAEHRGAEFVLMIIPAMTKFTDETYPIREYHQAMAAFCRESEMKCLDLLPAFWGLDGTEMWISPTDGHPDARGQRIIAEALAAFLAPLVPQRNGPANRL
jgi:lysophospholipase L1-like esterase